MRFPALACEDDRVAQGRGLDRVAAIAARAPSLGELPSWQLPATAGRDTMVHALAANGIVALDGWVPADELDRMQGFARQLEERLACVEELPHHAPDLVVDDGTDYSTHIAGSRTYANVRTGRWDRGLTDVGHVDRLDGFDDRWLHHFISPPDLIAVAEAAAGERYRSQMVNLYLNDSVTDTRPWHFDDNSTTAKVFIYLTDVNELADGPYCYALGSHRLSLARIATYPLNRLRGTFGDHDRFDHRRAVQVLGRAGTAVLSFQNGIHRGWPQAMGRRRVLFMHSLIPI